MKIRKNDSVKVMTGKYKGKVGRVLRVLPERERLVVEGVNIIKRHTRPTQDNPQGGIQEKEATIHISNVRLVVDGQPTKVGFKILEDKKKARISKRSGEVID